MSTRTIVERAAGLVAACAAILWGGAVHALSLDEARHLLTRTGFGAAPHEIEALRPLDREAAVDRLLQGLQDAASVPDVVPAPAFVARDIRADYLRRLGDYPPSSLLPPGVRYVPLTTWQETDLKLRGMREMTLLRTWWLDQMVRTSTPQAERLALFWHNHFTSRFWDVLGPRLMFDQLQTLRRLGASDFASLLSAMLHDPAMLIFLDNSVSSRGVPNENFARELLELFTLGVGHYSQRDITETARALAGLSVDFGGTWGYKFRPELQDDGIKTILGQAGRFGAEDVQRILLAQPRTAVFLAEKFYREYVSSEIDAAEVAQLAGVLRDQGYRLQPFLRALFLSDGFWSVAQRGNLVKSPVELLVGFARSVGLWLPDAGLLDQAALQLGQELFEPPTVAGWPGGLAWLNPYRMSRRQEVLRSLWRARDAQREALAVTGPDLLLRVAGQVYDLRDPVPYVVRVNGRRVWTARLQPGSVAKAGQVSPVWETVAVPRNRLPHPVRRVEVQFEQAAGHSGLFVDWVQVDGKRLPGVDSRTRWLSGFRCGWAGRVYCRSAMVFDMARAAVDVQGIASRAIGPAQRDPRRLGRQAADDFGPGVCDEQGQQLRWQALLPIAPLQPACCGPGSQQISLQSQLQALTLDAAYHLK